MTARFALGLSLAALVALAAPAHAAGIGKLDYLGEIVLPSGLKIAGEEFGGISGLDYDAATDTFYGISDDRSEYAPARFYTLKLKIDGKGVQGIDILGSHELRNADGKPFAKDSIDPEAIRVDVAHNTIYWSSEGDAEGRPGIYQADLDGNLVKSFDIPDAYMPDPGHTKGIRNNLAFEDLALTADGKTLIAGLENALVQDGPQTTLDAGSPSRIIEFDRATGEPTAEYVYEVGKIFAKSTAAKPSNDNGMSDFMTVDANALLTVERAFSAGIGNEINLYLASFDGATPVTGEASIKGTNYRPLTKTPLLKIDEGAFGGLNIDNIECVSWGPEVDGKKTIVIASDNNFNPNGEFSQFVVFTVEPAN